MRPFVCLSTQKRSLTRVDRLHQRTTTFHRCHSNDRQQLYFGQLRCLALWPILPCVGISIVYYRRVLRMFECHRVMLQRCSGCCYWTCWVNRNGTWNRETELLRSNVHEWHRPPYPIQKQIFARITSFHLDKGWLKCNSWCKHLHCYCTLHSQDHKCVIRLPYPFRRGSITQLQFKF